MQALILAAGLGQRLRPLTDRSAKCMVELNGRPLIAYTFDALALADVQRVVMVVGHGASGLRTLLGTQFGGLSVEYVVNPAYALTNNVYSLYRASEALGADDTLLLECDVVFDPAILLECRRSEWPNAAVVAKYESWMDGTVTLLDAQARVARFLLKHEQRAEARGSYYKTVNLYRFSRAFCREWLLPELAAFVERHDRGSYYEAALANLVERGVAEIGAVTTGDRPWYEIDTLDDLRAAQVLFGRPAEPLATASP